MYGQQSLQDLVFMMLYGGVALLAVGAALYLLFRRAHAIAPNIIPPKKLRRWTAAFFLAAAMSHVWFKSCERGINTSEAPLPEKSDASVDLFFDIVSGTVFV